MNPGRRLFLQGLLAAAGASRGVSKETGPQDDTALPLELEGLHFRVADNGWGEASLLEVRAVLQSAAGALWKYFPGLRREPFVVLRGRDGPIVHYQRNVMGEIVMKLDTEGYLWCQYVYQFAHEFCHILSGFTDSAGLRHKWFEETLCETASLFVLRRLTDSWKVEPPFPNWREYAPEFHRYALSVMDSRSQVGDGHLADFYQKHRATLERTPRDRSLNGAMALPLLELMEGTPASWEAVAWLNSAPSPKEATFASYLENWRTAVPVRHRDFVAEVMRRFGMEAPRPGAVGPAGPANSRD